MWGWQRLRSPAPSLIPRAPRSESEVRFHESRSIAETFPIGLPQPGDRTGALRREKKRERERFTQLGRELALHASPEADHHLLMIADLRSLAARWNASYAPPVDADALLGQLPSAGVVKYCKLHEESIARAPDIQVESKGFR